MNFKKKYLSLFITSLLVLCCQQVKAQQSADNNQREVESKMMNAIGLIKSYYVEKADMPNLTEKAIIEMLKELDPHSVYIPAKEVEKSNEPLVGNFDGIGVAFQIMKDTIIVIEVISGGPSEKLGVMAGDKIVKIDDKASTGDTITNTFVFNNLRGKKGTKVEVTVMRQGKQEPIVFKIIRDKIPIHSIDTYFMIDKEIGYIRLDRFSRTSVEEFNSAVKDLLAQGMKDLVFDLRGNGGGYLDIAIGLAEQFLDKGKLIVYTEGITNPKQEALSSSKGLFTKGRLVVLIDEGSASASEIVSGAVQDWDRGIVVGRRSFGKGLVQRIFNLPDGSQMRLTTSRYYTPSGRCIQKPYNDGVDAYYNDFMIRLNHKELITADSIKFPDSLRYQTASGRVVYGGGGIMPDIFVPIDTLRASDYLIDLRSKGVFNNFTVEWVNAHRETLLKTYPDFADFSKAYESMSVMTEFETFAKKEGVQKNTIKKDWVVSWISSYLNNEMRDTNDKATYSNYESYSKKVLNDTAMMRQIKERSASEDAKAQQIIERSNEYIDKTVKALIARNLYGSKYYSIVIADVDDGLKRGIEVIKNEKLFDSLKNPQKDGKKKEDSKKKEAGKSK